MSVIVLAPERRFDGVRAVLQDWCSAGLIDGFAWSHSGDPRSPLVRCSSEGISAPRLAEWAADEVVDGVLLVDLTGPARSTATGIDFATAVDRVFPATTVRRCRAVVADLDRPEVTSGIAVAGWFTVLLAPEDSVAPDRAGLPVGSVAESPAVYAAALSGIAGLWVGQQDSPLVGEPPSQGGDFRFTRSFHRVLDGGDLEARLHASLLRLDGVMPLPSIAGVAAVRVDDPGLAAREMADAVWRSHASLLRGPRQTVPTQAVRTIGAIDAIRMFVAFLGAALRNAPRRWLVATLDRARASAARAVQDAVYGSGDSAYEVVVAGITAEGRPAGWTDHRDAAVRLGRALDAGGDEHHVAVDAGALWADYTAGALTLADAGERRQGLPPVLLNGRRGVVTDAARIAPGPSGRFAAVPPALAASVGEQRIDAVDLLRASDLAETLRRAEQDQATARLASACRNDLADWLRASDDVYAVRVGGAIAGAFTHTRSEVAVLLEGLRAGATTDGVAERLGPMQRRLAKVLRVLAAVSGGALAVVIALAVTAVLGPLAAVGWSLGTVIVWAVSSVAVFVRGQRDLFRVLNERAQAEGRRSTDEANLRQALRDLRRQSDLYRQFLLWSRVLGVMLERPFGAVPSAPAGTPPLTGLPRSVRAGTLVPDDDDVARATADLRRELFIGGWMGPVWDAAIAAAPVLVGARGGELVGRPEALFSDSGAPDGLLAEWATRLEEHGAPRSGGDAYWSAALAVLQRPDHADVLARLRERVAVGAERTVSSTDFEEGVVRSAMTAVVPFGDALLTPAGAVDPARSEVRSARSGGSTGLGGAWTLVQLSGALPQQELTTLQQAPMSRPVVFDTEIASPVGGDF